MADRTRLVHIAAETTFSTDPDSDGSDYLPLQCVEVGYPDDRLELENREEKNGRNEDSEEEPTADGSGLDLTWRGRGFAAYGGSVDGTSPPANDAIDLMLRNALGVPIETAGEGVG